MSISDMDSKIKEHKLSVNCGNAELGEPKMFNLMFSTNVGPVSGSVAYLRPETAQVIFANFKLVQKMHG